jgi:hypothetical protein
MKTHPLIYAFALAIVNCSISHGIAQGFVNLDFESANVPSGTQPITLVSTSSGLPGWTAFGTSASLGSNSVTQIYYDAVSGQGPEICVNDANASFGGTSGFGPISGKYSVYLFSGNSGSVLDDVGISQTGLVPLGTQSLQFQAGFATSPFIVTLGGQTISIVPLAIFSNYTEYGGDISAFAGPTETLAFTETFPASGPPPGILSLDNIVFSSSPTPEPAACALILGGAVLFGFRDGRRKFSRPFGTRAISND